MALGYAIAKTGADEELRELAAAGYKRLVAHTIALTEESMRNIHAVGLAESDVERAALADPVSARR